MKSVALKTTASYTFFYVLLLPLFIVTTYLGSHYFAEKPSLYFTMMFSFVLVYLILLSVPVLFNIAWELIRTKSSKQLVAVLPIIVFLLSVIYLGTVGIINNLLAFLVVYVANKWVVNYKRKTQIILALIPLALIIGSSLLFVV